MSEGRREISQILEDPDEPMGPKDIAAMLNERGQKVAYGTVREMLSQMVKDGQAKKLVRGAYVHPDYQNCQRPRAQGEGEQGGQGVAQVTRGSHTGDSR